MGWLYILIASSGELLLVVALKQKQRWIVVLLLLISALMVGYFLNLALRLLESSTVYPLFVSLGAAGTLVIGRLVYDERLSVQQCCWVTLLFIGCIGLYLGAG